MECGHAEIIEMVEGRVLTHESSILLAAPIYYNVVF